MNKTKQERAHTVLFHLYKIPENENKFTVTEHRLMVACWGTLGEAKERDCLGTQGNNECTH